ncbi:hypothetical protein EGW08_003704 [Elysia chlorotica]|uniref:Piezo non-specific cation channel cap domain-containing protein n=1 Tax=Elysia chlorotica TaxID=188477 RepID=A0A433U414_ELYCH|nr:hypothetical protein EGW08_003704 [Elysia chlorotica]
MYVSFVLVLFKFFRTAFIDGRMVLVYVEELPCVDHLLVLFDQMFMAREMKDYWLEEELVAKLIFILRSPDVLFRITRMPQEVAKPPSGTSNKKNRFTALYNLYDQIQGTSLFR